MIERRVLGRTGLEVGLLGLGGANHSEVTQAELERIIDRAEEVGANCLDLYWHCEEQIGQAMRGRRGKFVLMSKVEVVPPQLERLPEAKRDTTVQIEESLRKLRTDYVDICQIHNVYDNATYDRLCLPDGVISRMLNAQQEGKVRFLGITSHSPTVLARAIKSGFFAEVMVPFNVVRRQYGQDPALGLFDLTQRLDVGVVIMKPLSAGRMAYNLSRALQFIFAHPVSVVIPGATSLAQWDLDITAARQFTSMSAAEREHCRDETWLLQEPHCTGCRYCMPCPADMNVAELVRLEQYVRVFGLTEWLSEERVGKLSVDLSACADCGICEAHCPEDFPIRERLLSSQKMLEEFSLQ